MTVYMLDTNTVSHLLKGHPGVLGRVVATPMSALCISAITAGELHFGLARRPEAKRLWRTVNEFLKRVEVLPWAGEVARTYGALRAELSSNGRMLAPLDLLIAAHALAHEAVLVTSDRAFANVAALSIQDWTH